MKKVLQSAKQAFTKTGIYLSIFSIIVTILGIIGYDKIFNSFLQRIFCVIAILVLSYIIAFLRCYFHNSVVIRAGNDRSIHIHFGSVFEKQGVIVIPCNRFFDTHVNDKVINEKSMMGQCVKEVFAGNVVELDKGISSSIKGILPQTKITKEGKCESYPIGTIAKVLKGSNEYYFVALTDIDEDCKSFCDMEMLHKSMISLLRFINKEANGRDVYIPLLGAGFSRLNREKQTILEYLIAVIKMADIPIQSKIYIILRKSEYDMFDLTRIH